MELRDEALGRPLDQLLLPVVLVAVDARPVVAALAISLTRLGGLHLVRVAMVLLVMHGELARVCSRYRSREHRWRLTMSLRRKHLLSLVHHGSSGAMMRRHGHIGSTLRLHAHGFHLGPLIHLVQHLRRHTLARMHRVIRLLPILRLVLRHHLHGRSTLRTHHSAKLCSHILLHAVKDAWLARCTVQHGLVGLLWAAVNALTIVTDSIGSAAVGFAICVSRIFGGCTPTLVNIV